MAQLMDAFPPAPERQVTLANWRTPPFNRWAFQHVREIVPSATIPRNREHILPLTSAPIDTTALQINPATKDPLSFDQYLSATNTDGFIAIRDGDVLIEHYANGMTADTPHILMSVSKSLLGLITANLVETGQLRLAQQVTAIIPEVSTTAYRNATVAQLLNMRAGVLFDEDYLATAGPIINYRKATNWNPLEPGEKAGDLRSFFADLTEVDGPHDGRFHYVSPNTDLLGWVIERATGSTYANLCSELLWQPMGAANDAYITVDRLGAPRVAGGFCATLRDLARVGVMLSNNGTINSRTIVSSEWIDEITSNGDPDAWDNGDFAELFPGQSMHYRDQWYVERGENPVIFGLGVHGQYLFVDRQQKLVIAKFSCDPLPLDAAADTLSRQGIGQVLAALRV